jgi:serine/threonine-protein kinase
LQIAHALEEAHEKGIVHRDLKPQNIKAPIEGKVKVLDFGLAKALDPPGAPSPTSSNLARSPTLTLGATVQGVVLGTAAYMAPEQARGVAVDKRADIWSFGVVLCEMLTGKRLFRGELVTDVLANVLTEPIDLAVLPPSTPAAIRGLIRRCLERNPRNRLRDIGDARWVLEEELAGGAIVDRPAAPPAASSRWTAILGAAAALFALLFAASLFVGRERPRPDSPVGIVRFPLVTDPSIFVYTELTTPFAVSRDGETIVFVAVKGLAGLELWVRTLDDPRPRRLDGTEGGMQPAISPDGEWVAFLVRDNQLRKVRLRGGAVTQLATLPSVSASLTWASNDEILFEVLGVEAGIHRVSASGGTPRELIPFDTAAGEIRQRRPFVLGAERVVLYASSISNGPTSLASYSLADGRRARLDLEGVQALGMVGGRLVYARADGNLMAVPFDPAAMKVTGAAIELPERVEATFIGTRVALAEGGTLVSRSGSSTNRLVLGDADGRTTPLGREVGNFSGPRFSPDGRRIVVASSGSATSASEEAQNLWLLERDTGEATRLTRGGGASAPAWMPDGRRVVYVRRGPEKRGEIWSLPLDGSAEPSRLVEIEGDVVEAVVAPDGRSLVAVRKGVVGTREELVSIALDGSSQVTSLLSAASREQVRRPTLPRISPDGRFLAFSDFATWEVYVRPLDGGGLVQVTEGGGWSPAWGPDSRQLYVAAGTVVGTGELRATPDLSVVNRRIVMQLGYSSEDFDLSPDGKSFVFVAPSSPGSDVQVAVRWSEGLRRAWQRPDRSGKVP